MELAWKYVEYAGNHLLKVILKDINKLTWKGRIIMKKRIEIKATFESVLFECELEYQKKLSELNKLYGK